jgi:hypothetical protein
LREKLPPAVVTADFCSSPHRKTTLAEEIAAPVGSVTVPFRTWASPGVLQLAIRGSGGAEVEAMGVSAAAPTL